MSAANMKSPWGSLNRVHNGISNPTGQTGVFIYGGVYSNILAGALGFAFTGGDAALADFWLGTPIQIVQADGFYASNHGWVTGLYGQDKDRVSNRLTATLGVRWNPWIPYVPEGNRISCLRPGSNPPSSPMRQ